MLTIQRTNAKKTGAIVTFGSPLPNDVVSLKIYPQSMSNDIEYEEPIEAFLHNEDLSLILMVLNGYTESIYDGKGLYHYSKRDITWINIRHILEPYNSYELRIVKSRNDGSLHREGRIILQMQDAVSLSYGIQGVLMKSISGNMN